MFPKNRRSGPGGVRLSYLPPLMVYLAAGISGLTAIVGVFFVKDYLGLSAAFLAGLAFWGGVPWLLKMPLGHFVDLIWRYKGILVFFGAGLIAASLLIMYGLISHTQAMEAHLSVETWFVLSFLLAPVGYVVQDVVADAMTVEAVPGVDENGVPFDEKSLKSMHTTMQTLGRAAIVGGGILVAAVNIYVFTGIGLKPPAEQASIYANLYLIALSIPLVSVLGVVLGWWISYRQRTASARTGKPAAGRDLPAEGSGGPTKPNWQILAGGLVFAVLTVAIGVGRVPFAQEVTFAGSLAIVIYLMSQLFKALKPRQRSMLLGTAVIIFAFRTVPSAGPGLTWWEIDALGFDQRFLSLLSLIASVFTLGAMLGLRRFMARKTIADIVILLTVLVAVMAVPNIGMYYGLHTWTAAHTGGVVDARFIAIADTALESPLYQIAMIPMLAWIAQNAPADLKATFFAVMASFTNLALSASQLGTKYLNNVFLVTREVRDPLTEKVITAADYSELGWLLISVFLIGLLLPLLTVALVQRSPWRTSQ